MARRRKAGPRRKTGKRTRSGRLSRAYKDPEIRDHGTKEFVEKRQYVVNGADPSLAATEKITPQQHTACQRYAWAHAMTFGRPWVQICPLGEHVGSEPPARMQEIAKDRLAKMDHVMSKAERLQIANLACFNVLPTWFLAARGNWRRMPEDERERKELLDGLDALSDWFE
jgi:hypothetical protein